MGRQGGSLLLLILLACHAAALLLFCKGFLLRRVVIPEYSKCSHPTSPSGSRETPSEPPSCYPHPRRFQRVVWLLVDALRYDFLEYDPRLDPSPPVFRNKLPFVRDLLRDRPQNARLFRFVADPPTTTMQRLKALTTGSLPTFVDVGSNFNSHRITEDSLPYQARSNGLNLTFIGDDTWLGLYEGYLTKVFPYPSLNVKDLHTVDNGVIRHMVPELGNRDAQFVVGHFLGVDHVGHTYGSTHWTMGEKLAQMNDVLKMIFSAVGEETVVFVFGDHGMTVSGDHGGETEMETTAGLLVYTPQPLFTPEMQSVRTVYQIDIVPTVSLLLGIPIPFSNLGMFIPEVFLPQEPDLTTQHTGDPTATGPTDSSSGLRGSSQGNSGSNDTSDGSTDTSDGSSDTSDSFRGSTDTSDGLRGSTDTSDGSTDTSDGLRGSTDGFSGRVTLQFLGQLQANAEQMQTYLKTYIKLSDDFPSDVYINLQNKLSRALKLHAEIKTTPDPSQEKLTRSAREYVEYMRAVKSMCHNVWAKFDNFHINQGVALFSMTVLLALLSLYDVEFSVSVLCRSLRIAFFVGVPISLLCLVVSPLPLEVGVGSILDVVLSLSFSPLLCFAVTHSLLLGHHVYTDIKERCTFAELSYLSSRLSFTYTFATVVAVVCSVSLVSNSFIIYEGDMTVFFVQSILICFLIQRAQSLSKRGVIPHSSDGNNEEMFLEEKSQFSLELILKGSWPLVLAMVVVRLSKVFHDCRDLQVTCESTSFTQAYQGALAVLGGLTSLRLSLSCLGVACVPLALAAWVWGSGRSRKLGFLELFCVYVGLPLSSLCVCGFWLIQSLPQPTLDSLPYWQHVLLPRVVYTVSLSTVGVCVLSLFGRNRTVRVSGGDTESEGVTRHTQSRDSMEPKSVSESVSSTVRHRAAGAPTEVGLKETGNSENSEVFGWNNDQGAHLVGAILLVAVWLPVAMVLNDGVALSAVLLVLQLSLTLSGLLHSQEYSWPAVVLWWLTSSQFFFGFGHHATVTSLRFDAGFVGLRGEMSGLSLLFAGLLVGINMLGSHLLLSLALLPLLPLSLSLKTSSTPTKRRLLLTIALQYILLHSFRTLVTMVTASLHRRHLMVWGVFSPRFLYEAAFLGVTHLSVTITLLLLLLLTHHTPHRTHHRS